MRFTLSELDILAGLGAGHTLESIAKRLLVGQSAVSKALRELERKCHVPIVEHGPNRLRLTRPGMELSAAAAKLVGGVNEFEHLVHSMERGDAGPVRVVAVTTPGNYIVPEVMGEFMQRYPQANVELKIVGGTQVWTEFGAGEYDLAVGQLWIGPQPLEAATWETRKLYEDEMVLFVSRGNPLADQPSVPWPMLRAQTLVTSYSKPYWTRVWDQVAPEPPFTGQLIRLAGHEAIKRLVAAGTGIGVLYRAALWRELARGSLRALNVPGFSVPFVYHMVTKPGRRLPIVDRFQEFLMERVSQMVEAFSARRQVVQASEQASDPGAA